MILTEVEIRITEASRKEVFMFVDRLAGEYRVPVSALRGFKGRAQELKGRVCKGFIDLAHKDVAYRIVAIEKFEIIERRRNLQ